MPSKFLYWAPSKLNCYEYSTSRNAKSLMFEYCGIKLVEVLEVQSEEFVLLAVVL